MGYMYGGTILRIDLSSGTIDREPTASYTKLWLGGRGLNSRILYTETDPAVKPLDPANVLMFSLGPFTGTMVPGSGRVEVAAKSPVIGIQGMSNMGGYWGPELKYAGYDSIILKGKAANPVYIAIHNDEVEIKDATHLWGMDTYRLINGYTTVSSAAAATSTYPSHTIQRRPLPIHSSRRANQKAARPRSVTRPYIRTSWE